MSSAGVRNNSLCKLDNESGGIDWPYCISFQTPPLFICADSQFGSLHSVRRCTFQLRVHFAMIEFFVLSLDSLPMVNVLRTPGKCIYLSMPPSAHSMKKQHQHFFSDQRSESVSRLLFCCDWQREVSFAHGLCHLSLRRAPAGLMTHSPAGRLLATAWVSRFTARANAGGLMKYASAEAGWPDKKSQQYCGWGAPECEALNIKGGIKG